MNASGKNYKGRTQLSISSGSMERIRSNKGSSAYWSVQKVRGSFNTAKGRHSPTAQLTSESSQRTVMPIATNNVPETIANVASPPGGAADGGMVAKARGALAQHLLTEEALAQVRALDAKEKRERIQAWVKGVHK